MLARGARTSTSWLVAWAVLALAPLLPYARPLLGWALSDSPLAYLVWVPPVAMLWAVDNLRRVQAYPDDGELNALLGGTLALVLGLALVGGPHLWPYVFTADDIALLLWPVWALALAWLWFGVGATPALLAPLAFLWLAWPPLMLLVAVHSQGLLLTLDRTLLGNLARLAPAWLRLAPGTGSVRILHAGRWLELTVASACSGADSILAAAILLPFLLSRSRGDPGRRIALIALALAVAFVLNLLRIGILFVALHAWGEAFALGLLHPVLGSLLFAALAVALAEVAERLDLLPRPKDAGVNTLALPTPARILGGAAAALLVLVGLLPVMTAAPGALGRPIGVRSLVPLALFPALPGLRPVILGTFDDSSILGPASDSAAVAYSDRAGAYALAEIWVTPTLGALSSYGFDQCLLFHGDDVRARRSLVLGPGTLATLYAVAMPPAHIGRAASLYLDLEWSHEVRVRGRSAYVRIALALPPEPSSAWRGQPSRKPTPAPASDALWLAPSSGSVPSVLRPELGRLVALAARFDQGLSTGEPI